MHSVPSDLALTPPTPRILIRPGNLRLKEELAEIWSHRELLIFLAWRDVKIRYRQTLFGVLWAVAQPLLSMIILSFLFGRLSVIPSDGAPYPLFVLAGLLPWGFFANAVASASNSLVSNASLVTKVYFPRMIVPAAAVAACVVDFAIGLLALFGLLFFFARWPTGSQLGALPLFGALNLLCALAVGLLLSAVNARYRDVRHAVPFLIQIGFFLSPVIYPVNLFPPRWAWVLLMNPMAGVIQGHRAALLGSPIDWEASLVSFGMIVLLSAVAVSVFRHTERSLADVV